MEMREKLKKLRGWLPKEPNGANVRLAIHPNSKKRRVAIIAGVSALIVCGFLLLMIIMALTNWIYPTDSKIFDTLIENKNFLLSIPGVVGAGIARNSSNNHIIGITVYVAENATSTSQIPQELGDFTIFIEKINATGNFDKNRMIISEEG